MTPSLSARATPRPSAGAVELALSPSGRLHLESATEPAAAVVDQVAERLAAAFGKGAGHGLLHLGTSEVGAALPAAFAFFRDFGSLVVARLCGLPDLEEQRDRAEVPASIDELAALAQAAPPFAGAEYLNGSVLVDLWTQTLLAFRAEIAAFDGTVQEYLRARNPVWQVVGRVHFHLAERKDDAQRPFAFLATYTTRVGVGNRVQHRALGQAVADSAHARDKNALLALLQPVHRAAEHSDCIKRLLDDGAIMRPLAWTPDEAYAFLQAIPACETAGVVVRVPDWWRARTPARPQVQVTVGGKQPAAVGLEALLDFDVSVTLGGEALSASELKALLAGADGLVQRSHQ